MSERIDVHRHGVTFHCLISTHSGGPGMRPWAEVEVESFALDHEDPDSWADETTAFPFTKDGVQAWLDNGGYDAINDAALDDAEVPDRLR